MCEQGVHRCRFRCRISGVIGVGGRQNGKNNVLDVSVQKRVLGILKEKILEHNKSWENDSNNDCGKVILPECPSKCPVAQPLRSHLRSSSRAQHSECEWPTAIGMRGRKKRFMLSRDDLETQRTQRWGEVSNRSQHGNFLFKSLSRDSANKPEANGNNEGKVVQMAETRNEGLENRGDFCIANHLHVTLHASIQCTDPLRAVPCQAATVVRPPPLFAITFRCSSMWMIQSKPSGLVDDGKRHLKTGRNIALASLQAVIHQLAEHFLTTTQEQ